MLAIHLLIILGSPGYGPRLGPLPSKGRPIFGAATSARDVPAPSPPYHFDTSRTRLALAVIEHLFKLDLISFEEPQATQFSQGRTVNKRHLPRYHRK